MYATTFTPAAHPEPATRWLPTSHLRDRLAELAVLPWGPAIAQERAEVVRELATRRDA
jgi:hypothetical protein